MRLPTTETVPDGHAIDACAPLDAVAMMLDAQQAALATVRAVSAEIAQGAVLMESAVRAGRHIHYAAAGSSGLMALADACELSGTFGLPAKAIHIHMAGGVPVDGIMPGDTEDDIAAGEQVAQQMTPGDVLIVLTASGKTPYALDIAHRAKATGATVIGFANNPGTPLLDMADLPVCLATPPEVIAGSTRLGAGTAQKVALNVMSSLMGIGLGHVFQGQMVNLVADNTKLVGRAEGIVAQIAGVPLQVAKDALARTKGATKPAILVASGSAPEEALQLLAIHQGHLAPCFQSLKSNQNQIV
ncbi:N-acetylmuramic acid 6-phosphate etherase [Yoonia sediminilitoris]|uniref:N-acetylmuramic acid 6-phosphate etherase n=1 Tax=Yoonia sediminilitoris TaxID=1286148 RepID=A0A2T6KIT8_9RHOB|nr:N-acetylmuramic acid 6-phosphate etherase [Yoonia sediminilitoris]PUB15618.1 N-acetylmuramic acid 6-phosphate etherase [Yoonia sediminilitoris]RCW96227.1 N-acetylmuramic acid 6-phosphate etherase [Yoonia sediminilitoris]